MSEKDILILETPYNNFFHSREYNFSSYKDISFLAVSRQRGELLEKSIRSVFELARYPEKIEILVWLDDDDLETIDRISNSEHVNKFNVKVYIGKRRGWRNLHFCREELIRKASGDILCLWSEECFMMDQNWDEGMHQYRGKFVILKHDVYLNTNDGTYKREYSGNPIPCLTRRIYDVIGRISGFAMSDVCLDYIGGWTGTVAGTSIRILLIGEKQIHNEPYTLEDMSGNPNYLIDLDSEKIIGYMDKYNIKYSLLPAFFVDMRYRCVCTLTGGKKGAMYRVEFIDDSSGENVYGASVYSYNVAWPFRCWYVPWNVKVFNVGGEIIYDYHFSAYGKLICIEMDGMSSVEDAFLWSYYIDKFREKYSCQIVCSSPFFGPLQKSFEKITFISDKYNRDDIEIRYRVGRFRELQGIYIHKEDYNNIPSGKIASNILGLEYENNDSEILRKYLKNEDKV